jgi:hypothetical protein
MYFESPRIKRWETKKKDRQDSTKEEKERTIVRERGKNKSGVTK